MSITLIGDVHGKYKKYHEIIREKDRHPYTLQIGDFGFNYDTLKNVDNTRHLIIPGNHDNYDNCYNHAHFLGDYGYTRLNNIDFFYYRGAYSIDRQDRTIGIDWWENEEVKIDSFMNARELYRDIQPDIMISHDCPSDVIDYLLEPHQRRYENITGWALNELFHIHQPKLWFFGHWHRSWNMNINGTNFRCLNELETYLLTKDDTVV
jgi:hypothetical protein